MYENALIHAFQVAKELAECKAELAGARKAAFEECKRRAVEAFWDEYRDAQESGLDPYAAAECGARAITEMYVGEYRLIKAGCEEAWQASRAETWKECKRRAVEIMTSMKRGGSQYRVFLGEVCEELAKAISEMEVE